MTWDFSLFGVLQQYASSQVANAGNTNRHRLDPWVRKMPWSRKWQHTSVFLPGEPHGQRSLASYSPWRRKELNMTEPLCTHTGWETHSRPKVHSTGSHRVFLQQHPGGRSHSSTTPQQYIMKTWWKQSERHSVVSDSLQLRGLYSPWNSPGQNTGVGSLSLLQGIFQTQGLNPGLSRIAGRFFTSWATKFDFR